MKVNRVKAIVLRQFYLISGSTTRILPLFIWGAIDIILWGFITKYLNYLTSHELDFIPTLLGAVLLWDFLTRIMHGVSMAFMEDSWSRNFLNIFASPLKISEYIAGLVTSGVCTSMIGLVIMLLLAVFAFGLSYLVYGIMIIPFFLILILFGIALGVFGCAMMLRFGPSSEWFIWPIPAIISPFAGVFYPLSTLPHWMQYISHALPPSYVFESMRNIINGNGFSTTSLAIGAALSILYIICACWTFTRVYKHAVQTGLIARYSAESIS